MATTKARRARRAKQNLVTTAIDTMLDAYNQDPNQALRLCHEWFGQKRWAQVLRPLLHHNYAKQAFIQGVEQCMRDFVLTTTSEKRAA